MLLVLENIFKKLNDESIRYIHWKSNEHLEAALNGDTDLDIMVHQDDYKRFIQIIQENGFSLYQSVGEQSYISISDYLLLDSESQKILHIHLHKGLMIGRKFYKEYLIPIEECYYNEAIFDSNYPVKIMNPAQEFVTLWLRYALKTTVLKYTLKRFSISKDFLRESQWLEQKIDKESLSNVIKDFDLDIEGELLDTFNEFISSNKSTCSTIRLIKKIRKMLKKHKTEHFTGLKYIYVRLKMIFRYILQCKLYMPVPYRRVNPNGGEIIALVGSDGAGKSTVLDSLETSLKKKIDVYHQYLGSGDGRSSLLRAPMQFIKNILKTSKKTSSGEKSTEKNVTSFKELSPAKVIWALVLAFEKKNKLKRVWKAKARGMIVICDRYPQREVVGINDGPLLFSWINSKKKIKRSLAEWEMQVYKLAESYKPDILIKLIVEPEIAIMRKPHEDLNNIKQKTEIIKKINIPAKKIVVIDANKPLERVLENVYSEVAKIL